MEIFLDALLDALIDGVKMLPFLYLAYLLIEWLERHHGENIENALAGGGRWGFLPGALLGCVPQCGFSAVASNFYASRVITPGTRSFIRLRVLRKVDFPQPEGPISAVISRSTRSTVIPLRASKLP